MTVSTSAYLILVAEKSIGPAVPGVVVPPIGVVFTLSPGRNIIGREGAIQVILPWTNISRQHAAVELLANGCWEIEDLNSRNGTSVNGTALQPRSLLPLVEGDRIQIPAHQGDIELLFTFQLSVATATARSVGNDEFETQPLVSPDLRS